MTVVHDMACEQARRELAELVTQPAAPLPAALADHLAACAACACHLADLSAAGGEGGDPRAPAGGAPSLAELAAPLVTAAERPWLRRLRAIGAALPPRALAALVLAAVLVSAWLVLPPAGSARSPLAAYIDRGVTELAGTQLVKRAEAVYRLMPAREGFAEHLAVTREMSEHSVQRGLAVVELREFVAELEGRPLSPAARYAAFRMMRYVANSNNEPVDAIAHVALQAPPEHPVARADLFVSLLERGKVADRNGLCRLAIEARLAGALADARALSRLCTSDRWYDRRWCSRECYHAANGNRLHAAQFMGSQSATVAWSLASTWSRHVGGEEDSRLAGMLARFAAPEGRVALAHAGLAWSVRGFGGMALALLVWLVFVALARRGLFAFLMAGDAAVDRDRRVLALAALFGTAMFAFETMGGALSWVVVPHGAGQDAAEMMESLKDLSQGATAPVRLDGPGGAWIAASLALALAVGAALTALAAWGARGSARWRVLLAVPLVTVAVLATPLAAGEREAGITGPLFLGVIFAAANRALGLSEHGRERSLLAMAFAGCLALGAAELWGAWLHHHIMLLPLGAWVAGAVLSLGVVPALTGLMLARLPGPVLARQRAFASAVTGTLPGFLIVLALWMHLRGGAWGGTLLGPLAEPRFVAGFALMLIAAQLALALGLRLAPDGEAAIAAEPAGRVRSVVRRITDLAAPALVWVTLGAAGAIGLGL